MGIIRRHPVLTLLLLVGLSPLLALGALEVVQHTPACSEWRARVDDLTDTEMKYGYQGGGVAPEFDRAYRHEETTYREQRVLVRAEIAHRLAESRPDLCM